MAYWLTKVAAINLVKDVIILKEYRKITPKVNAMVSNPFNKLSSIQFLTNSVTVVLPSPIGQFGPIL